MRKQIMLLENEDEARSVLAEHLREAGYSVITPVDGYVGLEIASEKPLDLILLNDLMPIIDGADFIRSLRASGIKAPAIIFTQTNGGANTAKFEMLAPYMLIPKPFQIDTLLKKVSHLISS